ncbi:ATP synthase membrane subunit K, mitochondrial-like [Schistocerca americana]|uniref:Up-regulated during skeletal muscle growth protein 5 n=1 Tax=Schistocerca gregaria TaxID=7010 RepID=A0A8E5JTI3_SCHGR|nr:ATP synthase membrane subunit K, mitochondrial-like [Schistocerca americana]XP_047102270.1 ATP synthase membrane subunit K, mitochondrial-like [Schistocerca piceifrons]XP_049782768.1 ATP synthase membrane subunit K, mitochondrial-like [Schistocerca cancellata]XP_049807053.1 ATP synthase membrane subunit K, mitochondrial-like [Schistocerca nitens]XP_049845963.1 ATP synthase membrane subunit K, mitochondrial-like [Schistocerca gregaria]XP_049954690.1 ATP synthase membrane subunit K, mitochond
MAGDAKVEEGQLKGLSKYFNSTTNTGRANVAKATYAGVGLVILYFMLKPKKK